MGPGSWNHVIWFWFLIYSTVNRSFIEDSGAGIKISPQDNNYIGLTDRVVTLTGSFEGQMRATDLIISKLTEDPLYLQSMNAPRSYPGAALFHLISHSYYTSPFLFNYILSPKSMRANWEK